MARTLYDDAQRLRPFAPNSLPFVATPSLRSRKGVEYNLLVLQKTFGVAEYGVSVNKTGR